MYVEINVADLLAYEASGGRVTSDERSYVTNNVVDLQAPYESVAEFLMVVESTFKRRRAVTKEGLAVELHKEEKYDFQTLIVYGNATEYVQWRNVLNDAKLENSHGMSYLDKGKKVINLMSKTEFKNSYNQKNPVYRIFCSSKSDVDIALKKFKAVFVYVLDHGMAKDAKFLYLKHDHQRDVQVIYHQYQDDDMKKELLDRLASTDKITLCFDSTIKEKLFAKSLRRVQGVVRGKYAGIMHVDWPDFAIATTDFVNEVILLGPPHPDNTAYIVHSLMMNKNPVTIHVLYINDDVKQVYVKTVFSKLT
jgi:hypothetical protein